MDGSAMAANAVEAAVTLLDGSELETTEIITDNIWIDASNVADYELIDRLKTAFIRNIHWQMPKRMLL